MISKEKIEKYFLYSINLSMKETYIHFGKFDYSFFTLKLDCKLHSLINNDIIFDYHLKKDDKNIIIMYKIYKSSHIEEFKYNWRKEKLKHLLK